jgi:hypothetical protein
LSYRGAKRASGNPLGLEAIAMIDVSESRPSMLESLSFLVAVLQFICPKRQAEHIANMTTKAAENREKARQKSIKAAETAARIAATVSKRYAIVKF